MDKRKLPARIPEKQKKKKVMQKAIRRLESRYDAEKQLIWRIYQASNRRLEGLLKQTKVDVGRLTEMQRKMVEAIAEGGKNPLSAKLMLWGVFSKAPVADRLRAGIKIKSFQEIYEGAFAGAVLEAGKGRYDHALRFLEDISLDWLTSPRGLNPGSIGKRALALRKAIASAWVATHAAEYARLEVQKTRFKGPGKYDRVLWSGEAVKSLAEVGTLDDVAAIGLIGRSCGEGAMKGDCSYSTGRIVTREALIASLRNLQRNFGKIRIKTKLNTQQIAYRFEVLFQRMGLGSAIRALPNLREIRGYSGPVSRVIQKKDLERLLREKLDGKVPLEIRRYLIGGSFGWKDLEACEGFLLRQKMIRSVGKKKEKQFVLTQKGKSIVGALCQEIGQISLRRH